MNTNKQTNKYQLLTRLVFEIFTKISILLLFHQLYQLTKLHHSFIELFDVRPAAQNLYIALCLIMIYNNAQ